MKLQSAESGGCMVLSHVPIVSARIFLRPITDEYADIIFDCSNKSIS